MDSQHVVMSLLLPLIFSGDLEVRRSEPGHSGEGAGAAGAERQEASAHQQRHYDMVISSKLDQRLHFLLFVNLSISLKLKFCL